MKTVRRLSAIPVVAGYMVFAQAMAQQVHAPGNYAPLSAPCSVQADGHCAATSTDIPLPVALRQETVNLALANLAAGPTPLYGGTYVFNQSCSGYNGGMLALRYRGADAASMVTILSKPASDNGSGSELIFGSSAIVDVTLPPGSTGCNATLSRVP